MEKSGNVANCVNLKNAQSSLNNCRNDENQYVDTIKKCIFLEESVEEIFITHFNKSNIKLTYRGQGKDFFISKKVNSFALAVNLLTIHF